MKPNDKAIEAAFAAAEAHIGNTSQREWLREILTAAYAAQFPPSEDYAGLIRSLRGEPPTNSTLDPLRAADAIEALLAERDTYKNWLDNYEKQFAAKVEELVKARLERDALAARLAPVDDEALVEIAAVYCSPEMNWNKMSEKWKNSCRRDARAAIAAIRPHIEAAERERCAKIADKHEHVWHSELAHPCARAIAAAIRSGSGK